MLALDGEPESYRPDEGPMHLLVAEAMPGAVSPPTNSARIRLVNTIGDPDAMLTAANLVLLLGANLVIASDSGDAAPNTQVLYSTPGFKGAAEFMAESLGVGIGRPGRYGHRRHRPHRRARVRLRGRGRPPSGVVHDDEHHIHHNPIHHE